MRASSTPRAAGLAPAFVLAVLLLAGSMTCRAADTKANMLYRLRQCGVTRLPTQAADVARSYPTEAAQLELDVIFYNWASRLSNTPLDLPTAEAVIGALAEGLNDQTVYWAVDYFQANPAPQAEPRLPARDDP